VLFLFDDQRLMHVGDQFFFKPLITKLAASGFRVRVRPSPSLKFFFSRHLENAGEDLTSFLVVTRTDMYPSIRRTPGINRAHFLYNTKSTQIASPVSNHIVDTFCEYFGLGSDSSVITTADYIDFPVGEESFGLSEKPSLLFFNNYVDSGRYRVWGGVGRRLLERVRESKEEGFIVHLGSAGDKARDGSDYRGLVDLDLRGRTSPQDLFSILSLPNVRRVFCHDTAILHIANLYDKPVSVAFRRFFRRGENQQKRRAYASLYRKDLSNFEFLD
jgi:ADP-heptose:LPS heptosyltransferase